MIVVLSGGMNSSTLLWDALHQFPNDRIEAVSFFYGQRHGRKELECAAMLAGLRQVQHWTLDVSGLSIVFAG